MLLTLKSPPFFISTPLRSPFSVRFRAQFSNQAQESQKEVTKGKDTDGMGSKSKILVIGATGFVGKYMVEASAKAAHPTYALVRDATFSDPSKSQLVDNFKNLGVNFLSGDVLDHESLVKAIKQVDVVISTVSFQLFKEQKRIISAIKEAGNVKKFYPSEFGNDAKRSHAVGPAKVTFDIKADIQRAIEAEGVPYTYVVSHFFNSAFLKNFGMPGLHSPPRDKVIIPGDGNTKVIFNKEEDVAAFTIQSVDDPRTLNKSLYVRPAANIYSFNELVALWEKKIGKSLEKEYLSEEEVVRLIKEAPRPRNVMMSLAHSAFITGDHTNFEIEPSFGVEATALYPDVKYTTVDEYLDQFV